MKFQDRAEAGKLLSKQLQSELKDLKHTLLYALPRGGVVVASEIAKGLKLPLDLVITRKIGHPYNAEYAIAAVGASGEPVLNEIETSRLDHNWLMHEIARQRTEIKRRRNAYRIAKAKPKGKRAILVDDGIATGLTMKAAVAELRKVGAKEIMIAVPVGPPDTFAELEQVADKVIALHVPRFFLGAIGNYYQEFDQVSDGEVKKLLAYNYSI